MSSCRKRKWICFLLEFLFESTAVRFCFWLKWSFFCGKYAYISCFTIAFCIAITLFFFSFLHLCGREHLSSLRTIIWVLRKVTQRSLYLHCIVNKKHRNICYCKQLNKNASKRLPVSWENARCKFNFFSVNYRQSYFINESYFLFVVNPFAFYIAGIAYAYKTWD